MTAELTRSIQERLERYEHPVAGIAGLAKHAGILPVWVGWEQFLGITPEGEILAVEHDVPVSKAAPERT
jgi:hypothetical protein